MKLVQVGMNLNITLDSGEKLSKKEENKEIRDRIKDKIKELNKLNMETASGRKKFTKLNSEIINYFTKKTKEVEQKKKASDKVKKKITKDSKQKTVRKSETEKVVKKVKETNNKTEALKEVETKPETKEVSSSTPRKRGNEYW